MDAGLSGGEGLNVVTGVCQDACRDCKVGQ